MLNLFFVGFFSISEGAKIVKENNLFYLLLILSYPVPLYKAIKLFAENTDACCVFLKGRGYIFGELLDNDYAEFLHKIRLSSKITTNCRQCKFIISLILCKLILVKRGFFAHKIDITLFRLMRRFYNFEKFNRKKKCMLYI